MEGNFPAKRFWRFVAAAVLAAVFGVVIDAVLLWRHAGETAASEEISVAENEEDTGWFSDVFGNFTDEYRSENRTHAPYSEGLSKEEVLAKMKRAGCVADGFLSGYGDEEEIAAMVRRSECEYLHRAIETWRHPPNFDEVERIRELVARPMIYGMFIAEAIDTKDDYTYGNEARDFSFKKMCKPGSDNYWGEHTCVPHTSRGEYRRYVDQIAKDAMHEGVRVFLFGQVFMQDDVSDSRMPEILQSMREYAQFLGVDIVIGAQTNDIVDEEYLRMFDFIEGGAGLRADGSIEHQPCFSRWWSPEEGGWCWALLHHERYASKANDVFIHFDWNGNVGDEMNAFASMNRSKRAETLRQLHGFFLKRDMGFLLPFLTPLDERNGGCYGEKARYYSPDNAHGCKDEDAMNAIMREAKG